MAKKLLDLYTDPSTNEEYEFVPCSPSETKRGGFIASPLDKNIDTNECVEINSGTDGKGYVVTTNIVPDDNTAIRNSLKANIESVFKFKFVYGMITKSGNNFKFSNVSYRIATKEYVSFDYDIDISVNDNFRFMINFINESSTVSTIDEYNNKCESTNWLTKYKIVAGTEFRITIAKTDSLESTDETVSISNLVSSLQVTTLLDSKLNLINDEIKGITDKHREDIDTIGNILNNKVINIDTIQDIENQILHDVCNKDKFDYNGLCVITGNEGEVLNLSPSNKNTPNGCIVYSLTVDKNDKIIISPRHWNSNEYQYNITITDSDKLVLSGFSVTKFTSVSSTDDVSFTASDSGTMFISIRKSPYSTPSEWNAVTDDSFEKAFFIYKIFKSYLPNSLSNMYNVYNDTGKTDLSFTPSWNGVICIDGGWVTATSNTLQAFWDAKQHGYSTCSCTITETSDGVLVLSDTDVVIGKASDESSGTITYKISETTWETLKPFKFNLKKYGLSTLENALKFSQYSHIRLVLNTSITNTETLIKILKLIKRYNQQDNIIFVCDNTDRIDALIEEYDAINLLIPVSDDPLDTYDKYIYRLGKTIISFDASLYGNTIVDEQIMDLSEKGFFIGVTNTNMENIESILNANPLYIEIDKTVKSTENWYNVISNIVMNQFDVEF